MTHGTPVPGVDTEGSGAGYERSVVRHEEEVALEKRRVPVGAVNVTKSIESEEVEFPLPRRVEYVDGYETAEPQVQDSGQIETLSDGSVSIPIFEERLVVQKQLVVKERVIVRKKTLTEEQVVETTLRKEQVDIETDGVVTAEEEEV